MYHWRSNEGITQEPTYFEDKRVPKYEKIGKEKVFVNSG